MDNYLLLFGLVVLILISVGVYLSVNEFREMADHPEEFHTNDTDIELKK